MICDLCWALVHCKGDSDGGECQCSECYELEMEVEDEQ